MVFQTLSGTPTTVRKKLYPLIGTRSDEAALRYIDIFVYETDAQQNRVLDGRHNCILYAYPINYGQDGRNMKGASGSTTQANNLGDNDYATFETASRYEIDTQKYLTGNVPSGETNSGTRITHLFIKSKGVTSFTTKFDADTASSAITIPKSVANWEGNKHALMLMVFKTFCIKFQQLKILLINWY